LAIAVDATRALAISSSHHAAFLVQLRTFSKVLLKPENRYAGKM
jgi:hypothetical protein